MKLYDRNKILNTFPMLNSFNKSNGLAWRIIEQNGFKILFGIMTDSTSDKKCFRLYWFYQCLYVPCPTYDIGCDEDIGIFSLSEIELAERKIHQELQKHSIHSFEEFIRQYGKKIPCYNQGLANRFFPLVATLITLEEYNKALSVLTKIKAKICIEQFFRGKKTSISTDTAMIQLMELRTLLQQRQYQSALSLLRKWQDFTIQALKI